MGYRMIDVVLGKNTDSFGSELARKIGADYADFRTGYYPDGENRPRIMASYDDLRGKEVLVVYRREQRSTRDEVARYRANFLDVVTTLSDDELFGASGVNVLMPYFLNGRQDHNPKTDDSEEVRMKDAGKGVGYRNLARQFRGAGASRMLTINPHFYRGKEGVYRVNWKQNGCDNPDDPHNHINVVCLSAIPALAKYAKDRIPEGAVVVSTDGGAGSMVREFGELVGREVLVFDDKERLDGIHVKHVGPDYDLEGRDVTVLDDIFTTLGTLRGRLKKLINPGIVDVLGIHAVLPAMTSAGGFDTIQEMTRPGGQLRSFVCTDTIRSDWEEVSVVDRLAEYLKTEVLEEATVSRT